MSRYEMLDDIYAYNDWANDKVLSLCEGLTDRQLDLPGDIGFGSLRAVLFHIWTTEKVWMERWTQVPWRPFPTDPDGTSLDEIRAGLNEVAAQRRSLVELNRANRWAEKITYQDSKKTEYTKPLFHLLVHVANHGVHHRAQALNYLRQFDRTIPIGIDYLFYRLVAGSVEQDPQSLSWLEDKGLEVGSMESDDPSYDPKMISLLYHGHDWAIRTVLEMANGVDVSALDRDYEMGPGTIRKCLLHLLDVEHWWVNLWTSDDPAGDNQAFPKSPDDTSLDEIGNQFAAIGQRRNDYLESVGIDESQRIITTRPGGYPTSFRVGETILHVALHGTHHRAQLVNMIKRSDGKVRDIDLLYSTED